MSAFDYVVGPWSVVFCVLHKNIRQFFIRFGSFIGQQGVHSRQGPASSPLHPEEYFLHLQYVSL